MNNLVPVTVFDRTNDLLKEPSCVVFRHLTLFDNVIEQLATRVFNHHDDIGGRRNHFVSSNKKRKVGVVVTLAPLCCHFFLGIQLDNVRMSQELQVLNFPLDASTQVHARNLFLVDNL